MLVITRRPHQSVRIGNGIMVHAIKIHEDQVQIGFTAPEDVPIYRAELRRPNERNDGRCRVCGAHLDHFGPQDGASHVALNFSDKDVERLFFSLSRLGYGDRFDRLEDMFLEVVAELCKAKGIA